MTSVDTRTNAGKCENGTGVLTLSETPSAHQSRATERLTRLSLLALSLTGSTAGWALQRLDISGRRARGQPHRLQSHLTLLGNNGGFCSSTAITVIAPHPRRCRETIP
ncbi:hypothetical protein SKAU_G00162870 [Synaphobranchus kaupii]|uniref:Uncharacterized protein n=1 Tax=Synaphobranchus kaupii TaxID=118154 RepID=A0A9Q1J024_SYNKA|nr:hypothetical protein SKAU_G00162870 [Synaphobranchus kaupii]